MNDDKVEVLDEEKEKIDFSNLKPRENIVEITKEDREKFVEKEENIEEKQDIQVNNEKFKLGTIGVIVTIFYSIFCLYVGYIVLLYLFVSITGFEILNAIISILILIFIIIPYILLYKAYKSKNKKLANGIIIYEFLLVVVTIIVFYFIIWPAVQSSIQNQWCGSITPCD